MPWKMLGHGSHAGAAQSTRKRSGKLADNFGTSVKGSIADDLANAPVKIDARRKTKVDAGGAQLGANQPARAASKILGLGGIPTVFSTDAPHRRYGREAFAKTLHASTFVVDGDDEWRTAQGSDLCHQIDNLLYLLGPVSDVSAYFNRLETKPVVEDVTAVLMRFDSGAVGYVAADYISPRRFTLAIHGTKANAYFDLDNDGLRLQRTGETKPLPVEYEPNDHLRAELEDFATAVRSQTQPEIDGRQAMVPLAIVLAACRSSAEGRSIALSELLAGE